MYKNNFGETNIEYISKSLKMKDGQNSSKEFTMVQRTVPCVVKPAISAMRKSINYLLM